MKKNLVIKLNDIIVELNYDTAVKKSIEFFLGSIIDINEIVNFRKKTCPANNLDCIQRFLSENNSFLRDKAILKKFSEYYIGKEYNGLISESSLIVDIKKLQELSKKNNVILLSLMPKEETDFIAKKFNLEKLKIISSESLDEALTQIKKQHKDFIYIGNTMLDYQKANEKGIPFIGYNLNVEQQIKAIEELSR